MRLKDKDLWLKDKGSRLKDLWLKDNDKNDLRLKDKDDLRAVIKVARSIREAHGTEASMGVGILAHFMHKIALFH